jgi:hypothetical protein
MYDIVHRKLMYLKGTNSTQFLKEILDPHI